MICSPQASLFWSSHAHHMTVVDWYLSNVICFKMSALAQNLTLGWLYLTSLSPTVTFTHFYLHPLSLSPTFTFTHFHFYPLLLSPTFTHFHVHPLSLSSRSKRIKLKSEPLEQSTNCDINLKFCSASSAPHPPPPSPSSLWGTPMEPSYPWNPGGWWMHSYLRWWRNPGGLGMEKWYRKTQETNKLVTGI